jgi:hypothetical protein
MDSAKSGQSGGWKGGNVNLSVCSWPASFWPAKIRGMRRWNDSPHWEAAPKAAEKRNIYKKIAGNTRSGLEWKR